MVFVIKNGCSRKFNPTKLYTHTSEKMKPEITFHSPVFSFYLPSYTLMCSDSDEYFDDVVSAVCPPPPPPPTPPRPPRRLAGATRFMQDLGYDDDEDENAVVIDTGMASVKACKCSNIPL